MQSHEPTEVPKETPFAEAASPFVRTTPPQPDQGAPPMPPPPAAPSLWASHRSTIDFVLAMLAYLMVLVGSVTFLQSNPQAPLRYVVAVLPVVPASLVVLVFIRALSRLDELQKRIQMQSFGFALGATALVTFGYGFLEGVGLPHLNWTFVLPLMAILWAVGTAIFTYRYR